MKVAIRMIVEVDPAAWTETYGVEGAKEIRDDVRAYVQGLVVDSAAASECSMTVSS